MKPLPLLFLALVLLGGLVLLSACDDQLTGLDASAEGARAEVADTGDEALLAALGVDATAARARFADTDVFFEFNSTDNDLGFQLFLDAEGWDKVVVIDPDLERVIDFEGQGPLAQLGITELRFESAEPSPAEVLALFQPGVYRFGGLTVDGRFLTGQSRLSNDLPTPPTFSPSDGDVVDPAHTVVTWNAPGAELIEVIISSDEVEGVLDVIVPASAPSLTVPAEFLVPGTMYKIEVLSITENGNKTITESEFVTSPVTIS